jgi:serine/threonine protein kinase
MVATLRFAHPAIVGAEQSAGMADFQDRLDAFIDGLTRDGTGHPRPDAERAALLDGARSLLDRIAFGEPAPTHRRASADGSLESGQILANTYTVLEIVGRGAAAEVYRVRHRELRSDHAIKMLRPEHACDPLLKTMMIDEAHALIVLLHDGIVRGRELLRHHDGRLFIVMDLLEGPTLAERIGVGRLHVDAVFALARRLATTLAVVHAAGYVHQDLSPENVILPDRRVEDAVLIDFGVASELTNGIATRRPVSFAGKLSFASPEQLSGSPVTAASDLYSLGLVLAAAARGAKLDMGRDEAGARRARSMGPRLADLPPPLRPLVRDLLRPDPRARPSAKSVTEQLARQAARPPARQRGRLRGLLPWVKAAR